MPAPSSPNRAGRPSRSPAPPTSTSTLAAAAPLAVSPRVACKLLDLSMSALYGLLDTGELSSFYVGRVRRIPVASIESYIARALVRAPPQPYGSAGRRQREARRPPRERAADTAA